MKKHLHIISAAMLIVMTALVAVACGSSSDDKNNGNPSNPTTNNLIVGSWRMTDGSDYYTYTLNADHQGMITSYVSEEGQIYNTPFSWSYDEATKRMTIIMKNYGDEGGNEIIVVEVMWFGNDQIYIKTISVNGKPVDNDMIQGPYNRI